MISVNLPTYSEHKPEATNIQLERDSECWQATFDKGPYATSGPVALPYTSDVDRFTVITYLAFLFPNHHITPTK